MTEQPSDRRRFRRIAFDAKTALRQNGQEWQVQLVDLSLKGLLVKRPSPWLGNATEPLTWISTWTPRPTCRCGYG